MCIFTPEAEIPFAGHPTLGTAAVIREEIADRAPDEVVLDLNVGEVPVRMDENGETLWMTQQPPEFGEQLAHDRLSAVLGLDGSARDADWPVQIVSTGLPTIVAPLADRTALTAIDVDRDAYDEVTSDRDIKNVLAFCLDPRSDENDVAVRVFAPFYGVPEDPATGSSNGCLAGYLARHRYTGSDNVSARVEQGYEMGRPSLIELATTDRGDEVEIEVSGRVVPVARGRLVRWRLSYRVDGLDSKKAPSVWTRCSRCAPHCVAVLASYAFVQTPARFSPTLSWTDQSVRGD